MKMPRAAAVLVAGLVGLACSNSGLKNRAGDAGAAIGGQAGKTISGGTTGGVGGTIGPGGAVGGSGSRTGGTIGPGGTGGASGSGIGGTIGPGGTGGASMGGTGGASMGGTGGTGGQGATAGSPPSHGGMCALYPMCNPGDDQVAMGIGRDVILPPGDCPAERECYSLNAGCGPVLCVLPEGVHCNDPLSCKPGDTQIPQWDQECKWYPSPCYVKYSCSQGSMIVCRYRADASVDAGASDAELDADVDEGTAPHCGDGIVETGEECDCGDGTVPVPTSCSGRNANNAYDGCTTRCSLGPHCGDSVVDAQYGEQCDFGEANGACFDASGKFAEYPGDTGCPPGTDVICTTTCRVVSVDPGSAD